MDKCHYCENYTSDEKSYYEHTMYEILNTSLIQGMSYRYREKKIKIPRCTTCYNKHNNQSLYITLPLWIISALGILYFFTYKINDGEFSFVSLIPAILLGGIPGVIVNFILDSLKITHKLFGVKPENDIKENLEVKRLMELGWKLNKPSNTEVTKDDISKTSPYKK